MNMTHRIGLLLGTLFVAAAVPLLPGQGKPGFSPGETAAITLKSGEKFEGKVLSDTPDSVEIEYRLTPKIKDKKIILKADIAEVKKQTPAEVEFEERGLARTLPTRDLMTAAEYESIIQDNLRTFVAKHPGTPQAAAVEKMIATLGDEKSKVVSGQLKMEGRWLDAASVKREAYNIEAYRRLLEMRARAQESSDTRYLNALRAFERLRTEFAASPFFLQAIPEAQEILKKFELQLSGNAQAPGMIGEAPILLQRRIDGLKQLQGTEAQAARASIDAEEQAYKSAREQQLRDKVKWREISKFDVKGLQDALATVAKERAELAALDLPAVRAEGELLMTVIRYIADQNVAEAGNAYEKASKLQNPINRPLIQALGKQLFALRENAKKEQKAAAAPAMAATAPTPEGGAATNPVAEALKKQEEEKKKAAAAGKGTPTPPKSDAPQPSAASQASPAPVVAPSPAEESSGLIETLNEYGLYIGAGLLVIILVAWLVGRRKKEKDE